MKKWITCEELCRHWGINIYDLTELVAACKLSPYHADNLSIIEFGNYDTFEKIEPGITGADPFTLTVDDVRKLVFRISDVTEYEKKNDIIPDIIPKNPSEQEQNIAEIEQKAFEGHFEDAVTISDLKDEIEKLKRPDDNKELTVPHPTRALNQNIVNFLTKATDDFWHIGFEGRDARIKNLDGLLYISYLLANPDTSISCLSLYQIASGNTPEKNISKEAIKEGLYTGGSTQPINDNKARIDYKEKYLELQIDLNKADSEMERGEIEKDMAAIIPHLKRNTFADPNKKKAQINIKRCLDKAYKALINSNMQAMVEHLKRHIKTDDAYGLMYIGDKKWEITIK